MSFGATEITGLGTGGMIVNLQLQDVPSQDFKKGIYLKHPCFKKGNLFETPMFFKGNLFETPLF